MAQPPEQAGSDAGSVFGNLPTSRPGTRSPRRDRAKTAGKPSQPAETRHESASPPPEAAARPRRAAPPKPPPAREAEDQRGIGGVEDLAWAGVAVAAEAATLGVRLASKAIEAMRGTAERE